MNFTKPQMIALGAIAIAGLLFIGLYKPSREPVLGTDFTFSSTTQATSSVGVYAWTSVLSGDSSRGFASFCNDSVASNSAIYLGLGATATISSLGGYGIKIPSNTCYKMTQAEMFYGTVYAIASSATSTLLEVYK